MIVTLHIKNIGIIEDLVVDFNEGFNVLTGETGAGKSLIIDSLSILCGGRFSKEVIRKGETYSFVEACIYNPSNEYAEDGNIIVSREINLSGKNLCKINGRLVTVSTLKSVMSSIIDIHAQNENHDLMCQSSHIKYLDKYSNDELLILKKEYQKLYDRYNDIKRILEKNYGNDIEKQRTLDLLTYQLNEIDNAKLKIDEEEILQKQLNIVQNHEKIYSNLSMVHEIFTENVITGLENISKCLGKIENLDDKYKLKYELVKNIYYDVQDISASLSEFIYEEDLNDFDFNEVTNRIELINSLKRKYGYNIEEILKFREEVNNKINIIENLEVENKKLKEESIILENKMFSLCDKMHEIRLKNATVLSEKINSELLDLEMKNASFKVIIERSNTFNENGLDKVEFVISTNLGEEYKSLAKIASGGEISRIMFAIKVVFSDMNNTVMIFDEIDTGISGKAAKAVSEKMYKVSKKHQILCITHLAVIAARADYNYLIKKDIKMSRTTTTINLLNEEETLKEMARISSGEVTEITLKHAMELKNMLKLTA